MTEQRDGSYSNCSICEQRLGELQRESAAACSMLLAAFIECGIEQGLHSRFDVIRRLREEQGKLARSGNRLAFDMLGDVTRQLISAY